MFINTHHSPIFSLHTSYIYCNLFIRIIASSVCRSKIGKLGLIINFPRNKLQLQSNPYIQPFQLLSLSIHRYTSSIKEPIRSIFVNFANFSSQPYSFNFIQQFYLKLETFSLNSTLSFNYYYHHPNILCLDSLSIRSLLRLEILKFSRNQETNSLLPPFISSLVWSSAANLLFISHLCRRGLFCNSTILGNGFDAFANKLLLNSAGRIY